jgi:hypothetical protein
MAPIRRLVLDVLKPHDPGPVAVARAVSDLDGVSGVNATLIETDRKVENLKLTVEGGAVDDDAVRAEVERLGGTVHSVDEVACGEELVEESPTLQDALGQ